MQGPGDGEQATGKSQDYTRDPGGLPPETGPGAARAKRLRAERHQGKKSQLRQDIHLTTGATSLSNLFHSLLSILI